MVGIDARGYAGRHTLPAIQVVPSGGYQHRYRFFLRRTAFRFLRSSRVSPPRYKQVARMLSKANRILGVACGFRSSLDNAREEHARNTTKSGDMNTTPWMHHSEPFGKLRINSVKVSQSDLSELGRRILREACPE